MKLDFSNAGTKLGKEYRSVSGLEIDDRWALWFELYCHAFLQKLESLGFTNDADLERLLDHMNQYDDLGDFICQDHEHHELAAYGLVVFDRMLRAETKVSNFEFFNLHSELTECFVSMEKDFIEERLKLSRSELLSGYAKKRHAENHATKAAVFDWLDSNMANFKSMDKAAEAVTKQQPIAFRTARDYVSQWKKLRAAGTA